MATNIGVKAGAGRGILAVTGVVMGIEISSSPQAVNVFNPPLESLASVL
jgi:hypothetical protein